MPFLLPILFLFLEDLGRLYIKGVATQVALILGNAFSWPHFSGYNHMLLLELTHS